MDELIFDFPADQGDRQEPHKIGKRRHNGDIDRHIALHASSSFRGNSSAAAAQMTSDSTMVRMPEEIAENTGR